MYVTGKGDSGQLGLGRSVKMCHGPTTLSLPAGIKYITAGIAHSGMYNNSNIMHHTSVPFHHITIVLITDYGYVYTFGSGTGGQLGLGGTKDVYEVCPMYIDPYI